MILCGLTIVLSVSIQNFVVDLEGLYSIHTEVLFSETFEFEYTYIEVTSYIAKYREIL